VARNLAAVRGTIERAARRTGRDPRDVRLVAVTKYVGADVIRALLGAGAVDLGESRAQQLALRAAELGACDLAPWDSGGPGPRWHMIGHLQRNKVRALLRHSRIIHSVDSERLALEIDHEAGRIDARVDVLLEVNISGEAAKQGVSPAEAPRLAEAVGRLPHVRLRGLMTMAPLEGDPEATRPVFAALRETLASLVQRGAASPECRDLSMGMTNDYAVAVEEGATIVRVGSALFAGLVE